MFKGSLVIVTDSAISSRINSQFWQQAATIIKIDHHLETEAYGKLNWIDEKSSSVSQMIVMIITTLKLPINKTIAEILYMGIISDTNRFHYPVVTSITLDMLAFLTSYQLDLNKIYNQYYEQTLVILKLKAIILEKYVINKNKIIVCCLPATILQPLNISAFQANEQVDLLANINGGEIWIMFSQTTINGPIIGIFRSNKIKVNVIAQQFGGGHFHYAGGSFKNWTEVEEIIKAYNT